MKLEYSDFKKEAIDSLQLMESDKALDAMTDIAKHHPEYAHYIMQGFCDLKQKDKSTDFVNSLSEAAIQLTVDFLCTVYDAPNKVELYKTIFNQNSEIPKEKRCNLFNLKKPFQAARDAELIDEGRYDVLNRTVKMTLVPVARALASRRRSLV